jgi:hypothetical protein
MIPPTSIDGTDITGATIDGTDVTEITVDGQTVFSAGPASGTKIYLADDQGGRVFAYDLTTPFDLSTRTNQTTFNTDLSRIHALTWKPDGTRYWTGELVTGSDLNQFDTNTPFELQQQNKQTINPISGRISGVEWDDDGSHLFVLQEGFFNGPKLFKFSVSSNYDISSTVSQVDSLNISGDLRSFQFSSDGLTLFVGILNQDGDQIDLANPFDLSSVTNTTTWSNTPFGDILEGIDISNDGFKLMTFDDATKKVQISILNTANDITSGIASSTNFSQSGFSRAGECTFIR